MRRDWRPGVAETLAGRRCVDFRRHGETVGEPSPSPDMATDSGGARGRVLLPRHDASSSLMSQPGSS